MYQITFKADTEGTVVESFKSGVQFSRRVFIFGTPERNKHINM